MVNMEKCVSSDLCVKLHSRNVLSIVFYKHNEC